MTFFRAKSGGAREGPRTEAPQLAALCYRKSGPSTEVLLITSRDTGRWVIPKGWPIDGLSPQDAATREAFEEAGVKGKVTGAALGEYSYLKRLGGGRSLPCRVVVYPLEVSELAGDFPEKGQRALKWFKPVKAATKVDEPELKAILAAFRAPG